MYCLLHDGSRKILRLFFLEINVLNICLLQEETLNKIINSPVVLSMCGVICSVYEKLIRSPAGFVSHRKHSHKKGIKVRKYHWPLTPRICLSVGYEKDTQPLVDWGRKWLVNFNSSKTKLLHLLKTENPCCIPLECPMLDPTGAHLCAYLVLHCQLFIDVTQTLNQ